MTDELYDITIIGGGPTGLFAAFYAGLREMRTKIIDSLDQLGGQLTALYPEKLIYDVAGFPAVLAKTLTSELVRQAMQYRPAVQLNERVAQFKLTSTGVFELRTDAAVHASRTVLIATGGGAFTPKKLPQFARYEGQGLHYFVKDLGAMRGKRILVIGGGDSAVDWALNLWRVANDITLIHRRDVFRAHEDSVRQLMASTVNVRTFHELKNLAGEPHVQTATIFDNRTGREQTLAVDAVIASLGFVSSLGPIADWGLALDRGGIIVDTMMQTSVPGIFAAGDIASYPGKLKLIATGFGEAAIAVNFAKVFIDPASQAFPGHSSTIVPKKRGVSG